MAKDFEEGIIEVSESELTDELRGVILDEDRSVYQRRIIGGGFLALLIAAIISWSYYYSTRTPEQILREKLLDRQQVAQMLVEASRTLRALQVNTRQLKAALTSTLDVASTPLRASDVPQAPYIPERHAAMLEALEGLLRLELEGVLHPENPKDQEFLKDSLTRLGAFRLEYYDNGLLEYRPLSERVWVQLELEDEEKRRRPGTEAIIKSIELKLKQLEEEESLTLAGMAYTLGKWYRYHNDTNNANRCFEVGRRYVEGYKRAEKFFDGRRPEVLSPLWSEYVGCLEALAQGALEERHYREARSYLVRIFNTPDNAVLLTSALTAANAPKTNKKIEEIKNDIDTVKYGIAFPLELSGFPYFEENDHNIHWERLIESLQGSFIEPDNKIAHLLWNTLPAAKQNLIRSTKTLTPEVIDQLKPNLVKGLNTLVDDISLLQQVELVPGDLTPYTKILFEKSNQQSLGEQERQALNRAIVEAKIGDSLNRRFILNDGPRLHNVLNAEQKAQLLELFEMEAAERAATQSDHRLLKEKITHLLQGKHHATLQELHDQLQKRYQAVEKELAKTENTLHTEDINLQRLKLDMESLSQQSSIDMGKLADMQRREEQALKRQRVARAQKRRARETLDKLESAMSHLTAPMKQRLEGLEKQLAALQTEVTRRRTSIVEEGTPLLNQIERQIALKEQYVTLLKSLRSNEGHVKLRHLSAKMEEIQEKIAAVKERMRTLKGNQWEAAQRELFAFDNQRHQIIKEFQQLYEPLQEKAEKIAASEKEIWDAANTLKSTREEIQKLLGTEEKPGALELKAKKRAHLLLQRPEWGEAAAMRDTEIKALNEEIAADHARLSLLLQQEAQAKNLLRSFHPDISADNPLYLTQGQLAPLKNYLQRQDALMDEYHTLWQHNLLLRKIGDHQETILQNLKLISHSLDTVQTLDEGQTRDLIRFMQNVIEAKRQLEDSKRKLRIVLNNPRLDAALGDLAGRGFRLDTIEMFQMEQELGLNLNSYQQAFEERNDILARMAEALKEKEALETRKVQATRQRNQALIDSLAPKVANQESRIRFLSKQEHDVNRRLLDLAKDYEYRWDKAKKFRKSLAPQMDSYQEKLAALSEEMVVADARLEALRQEIFQTAEALRKEATTLRIEDLGSLDDLIHQQEKDLAHLKKMRGLKQQENYFKGKALYWIAKTFYDQSKLATFEELLRSNSIATSILEDEQRNGLYAYKEFDTEYLYSDRFLGYAAKEDGNRVNYEAWINFLEESALEIFRHEVPRYTASTSGDKGWVTYLRSRVDQDLNSFIANSRFLTGEIHLRRALRFVRMQEVASKEVKQARKEFDLATAALLSFLDFALPFRYQEDPMQQLSEVATEGQEFPFPSRKPIRLVNQAQIYLGAIATLKGENHEAIDHFRRLLRELVLVMAEEDNIDPDDDTLATGQIDPILLEGYQYNVAVYPLYASLLSRYSIANEALYRLGHSYQQLANEEQARIVEASLLPENQIKEHQNRFEEYGTRAIAYYSQLILTQAYSPYRRAALLKRSKMYRDLGDFAAARNDLVALIGSPYDRGGSLDPRDINDKGDLPGEIDPGYALVLFELGKVHFEEGDYAAAADAFLHAQEGDPDDEYVLRSKIAYARSLKEGHHWLMAHLFLKEITDSIPSIPAEFKHLINADLYLDLAEVNTHMGNLAQANGMAKKVFKYSPPHLVVKGELELNNPYGMAILQEDYRDAIRPLALACQLIAENSLKQKNLADATSHFQKAERLFRMLPWQEDRILRTKKRDDFEKYRQGKILAARAGLHKVRAEELFFQAFGDFRLKHDLWRRNSEQQDLERLNEGINEALTHSEAFQAKFQEAFDSLTRFYMAEKEKLPEEIERRHVLARREADQRHGGQNLLRYQALTRIRETVIRFHSLPVETFLTRLFEFFTRGSIEDAIMDDYVLTFARTLSLTKKDRLVMQSGKSNFDNLLALSDLSSRAEGFPSQFLRWLEMEMQQTGLDDLFIPVSPQAKILEALDLYRVALLAHVETPEAYDLLVEITEGYLDDIVKPAGRVNTPENVWRMAEIAATAAQSSEDWRRMARFNRFILQPEYSAYFVLEEGFDKLRAELALAKALLELSQQAMGDLVFLFDEEEKTRRQAEVSNWTREAKDLLTHLAQIEDSSTVVTTTKIIAKEMLKAL